MAVMQSVQLLAQDLRRLVEGDVLEKDWERAMYATDASSYEIMPLCVVLPKSTDDVVKVVKYAHDRKVPVIARGGGSGLAGQAVGAGIILDFTKYLNNVIELNTEQDYVVVQPGIYKSVLDNFLKKSGKYLPPDPSSSDYCTIGGMIANNGCGSHTVKYGAVIDYVLSLDVVLGNGELITTKPVGLADKFWEGIERDQSLEAQVYKKTRVLLEENRELIQKKIPRMKKNSSGYRLERVIENGVFDVGKLLVSSEGTLGVVVKAKIKVIDLPMQRGLSLLFFDDLERAGDAVSHIVPLGPSAVELLDDGIIRLASSLYPDLRERIPEYVKAVLLVEFDGDDIEGIKSNISKLENLITKEKPLAKHFEAALNPADMKKLWDVRKKALAFAFKMREGRRRVVSFIEDTVVEPSKLGTFIKKLYEIYDKYGVKGVVYGHAGDGHVHTRPLLDLKSESDRRIMQKIAEETFSLAKEYNGSITGEHGDGLARVDYIKFQYGEEVYQLFRRVKQIFDPENVMNPGKKVADQPALLRDMRYSPEYRTRPVKTQLNWGLKGNKVLKSITGFDEELDYEGEVELCFGCGFCRGGAVVGSGRMCPVYRGMGNEVDSCRGRNNLLRWMGKVSGLAKSFELTDEYGEAIYKHCIQCKMCLLDCPTNVDVGKLMAEARARYAAVKGLPKGYGFFMNIDKYGEAGCRLAPISNWLFGRKSFRTVMEWVTGIDRNVNFPPFHGRTFEERFKEYEPALKDDRREVVFFHDAYIDYNNPELGMAIVKILEKNGFRTIVPPQKSSGLPALTEGAPDVAREIARYNIDNLFPYAEKGIPIVCFSPAAGLTLKMEYENILESREVRTVAENTYDIHEFLYDLHRKGQLVEDFKPIDKSVYVHIHCHDLVQRVESSILGVLKLIPKLNIDVLERGCCGVGGSFRFIKKNFDISLRIGKELFDVVRQSPREVYTTGELCMLQMQYGSGKPVGLTMDLIREAYGV